MVKKPAKKPAKKPTKATKAKSAPAKKAPAKKAPAKKAPAKKAPAKKAPAKKAPARKAPARKAAARKAPAAKAPAARKKAMPDTVKLVQAQAVALLHGAVSEAVRSDMPDLTARQMAVLLSINSSDGPATVRGLAGDLNLQKPAISRALDRLADLGFIERKTDTGDRRNVLIRATGGGNAYLRKFADLVVRAGRMKH